MDAQQRSVLRGLLRSFLGRVLSFLLLRRKSRKQDGEPPDNYGGTD